MGDGQQGNVQIDTAGGFEGVGDADWNNTLIVISQFLRIHVAFSVSHFHFLLICCVTPKLDTLYRGNWITRYYYPTACEISRSCHGCESRTLRSEAVFFFFAYRTKKPMGALGALSMCHNVRRNDILDFKFYSILQSNSLVYY